MRRVRIIPLGMAAALLTGCSSELPPAGQLILHVNTDAPVPRSVPAEDPFAEPLALFDTVRFDLYPAGADSACVECSRAFGIDEQKLANGEVSVGIVPANRSNPGVAQVRLYLAEVEPWDEPRPAGTIEAWVALPPIEDEGIVELTIVLPTEAVGTSLGSLQQPAAPQLGPPDPNLVGTWPGAQRVPCAAPPEPGQACVPGGAYWMGHPTFVIVPDPGLEADQRRIVVLSPFYIDLAEVTVAQFRDSGLAQPSPEQSDPVEWDGTEPELAPPPGSTAFCTYTVEPGEREELPVTCVSRELAAAYCAQQQATLPTEAQLEYLMGGFRGAGFVWGHETPRCDEAVFARAYSGQSAGDGTCRMASGPLDSPAPLAPGSGTLDRLELGDETVVDLTANVSEWARDEWSRQDESCWGTGVLHDPECTSASAFDEPLAPCKGGNWTEPPELLHAAKRWGVRIEQPAMFNIAQIGFRCARPASE
jgi:formylglycine-generating enzyme required for sulfatase activity